MWRDELSQSTDNLEQSWIPDTYHVYGNKLNELGVCDTRTIFHEQRFILSNNALDPKVYQVTKVKDLNPQGIIKLSLKQDEYNAKRDNIDLMVCDYYEDNGDILIEEPQLIEPFNPIRDMSTSEIVRMTVDEQGAYTVSNSKDRKLYIGQSSYFQVEFSQSNIIPQWRIQMIDSSNSYTDAEIIYWEGLMKITKFNNNMISLKPGKANTLKGKHFMLSVADDKGDFYSSIELEVAE